MSDNKNHTVIVFTTSSCSWCRRTKQYMREHKVAFKEIDVEKNKSAAQDIVRKTGQMGVPVILIDNRPIVGFNKHLIDKLLGLKPHTKH